jgi:uncharacterized integral membrane protein
MQWYFERMTTGDPQFEGVYGPYTITSTDRQEVQRYRISLLVAGLAMTAALVHWWQFGDSWAWIWLVPLMAGLGLALKWIHIYLRPLHNALKLFWLIGCLGWGLLLIRAGPNEALAMLAAQPLWILDLACAIHGRTRLGTEVDPHLSATTPQRTEVVLVDRLPGLGTPVNSSWSE